MRQNTRLSEEHVSEKTTERRQEQWQKQKDCIMKMFI